MQNQIRSTTGGLISSGRTSSVATTDATVTTIDTLTLGANSAGVIQYTVKGVAADGNAITGSAIVRYSKVAGTLTLGTPSDILAVAADTSLSGGTIAVAALSNNIIVTVKGKASVNISWQCSLTIL